MNELKAKLLPIIVAITSFLIISVIYLYPAVEGKSLYMHDIVQHKGSAQELIDHRNETGEEALWTNSMFGGMPGYFVSTIYHGNKIRFFHRLLVLNNWRPICFIFLYLLGFYIALLSFNVNKWLAVAGAIAYAFSTYFIIIIEAGHISKVLALGYMPPIIGGFYLIIRKQKYIIGGLLFSIFLVLQILVVHFQITYYTAIILICFGISELVYLIKEKKYNHILKSIGVLTFFSILVILTNLSSFLVTKEYSKYSTRGKSEISIDGENETAGLNKDYITAWCIGKGETLTLLIPNFRGGSSGESFKKDGEVTKYLRRNPRVYEAVQKGAVRMSRYWGDQPHTSPVYVGAVVMFLFVLSLLILSNRMRIWAIVAVILSILLSWGSNLQWFTDLFLDYIPGYNKFRAVSMILIIAEFVIPFLGILAMNEIVQGEKDLKKLKKAVLNAFAVTGGLCFLFILASGTFSYTGLGDASLNNPSYSGLLDVIKEERKSYLIADAFRSLIYIALAAGALYLYTARKMKVSYLIVIIGALILFDLWGINKRYLNNDSFISKSKTKNVFTKSKADEYILRDNSEHRVLNLAVNTFNDAKTSYHHHSIGGYHGAKLRRYQDLVERKIQPEIQGMIRGLQTSTPDKYDSVLAQQHVLNMLNTKYVIYNPQAAPIVNMQSNGNVWFVDDYKIVADPNEEIALTGNVDHKNIAVVDERFKGLIENKNISNDSVAEIKLTKYLPNELTYRAVSSKEQLAVFSEVYYPKGWQAYIDDEPVEHFRVNYILRAMIVPPGEHTIVFKFKPKSYFVGEKVSLASSLLLIVLLIGTVGYEFKNSRKEEKA